ncbi:putative P2Y purinoceptor 10 [Erpetoichthys calabaricus]|uniref:putative P2Y purinoceptor 10 n=1 Tax=Erpetoichthys calabaricus TaxID=27687 RepID=UPI00109F5FE4|nr:putative P2Y purinoceptor 10 [Erpetoichthys calabaricus]XP_028671774.1 putative P2Y purinoceptor 10 [Erpetoichthys calabaricus]
MANNSTFNCSGEKIPSFRTETLYFIFYLIIFIPGLLGNSIALWVLCRFINKKSRAVIFMINLTLADLAHVFSLPLRIFYYLNEIWPFGKAMCLMCFYLKYLNMYASIVFLVCISIQRCVFLINPFKAKNWKRRYDIAISVILWVVVGLSCSPFILMRNTASANFSNCFRDLPTRKIEMHQSVIMISFGELLGFLIPLLVISMCTYRIINSLQQDGTMLRASDRRKALRMVHMCTLVFLFCFVPYHLNFLFYMMVNQDIITNCTFRKVILTFHPISLCLASLSCCLNPFIYYFLTTEFRELSHRGSIVIRSRLMSRESGSSIRE